MGRGHRVRSAGVGALALLALGVACEPPPPPPSFTVTTTADLPDADPGDGLCQAAGGACTLRAAVEEGNALGSADVSLPAGAYVLDADLAVGGALRWIVDPADDVTIEGSGSQPVALHVSAGGALTLDGVYSYLNITVDGTFVARHSRVDAYAGVPLTIGDGGIAVVQQSRLGTIGGDDAIRNAGTLLIDYSQVGGTFAFRFTVIDLGALSTAPGASTVVRGTWLASGCVGQAPTSQGHNADAGTACGLTGTGDVSDAPPVIPAGTDHVLPPAAILDAIPFGVAGCGTEVVADIDGRPRPTDTDDDGTAACEIGAIEYTEIPTGS